MITQDGLATAANVLGKASLFDQTFARPDPSITAAWAEVIGHLDREDCLAAVAEHYRVETRRIMPKDVLDGVRRMRAARLEREPEAIPDADPDDVPAYLAALRAGRFRAAEGEKPRDVAKLIKGTAHGLPRGVA